MMSYVAGGIAFLSCVILAYLRGRIAGKESANRDWEERARRLSARVATAENEADRLKNRPAGRLPY